MSNLSRLEFPGSAPQSLVHSRNRNKQSRQQIGACFTCQIVQNIVATRSDQKVCHGENQNLWVSLVLGGTFRDEVTDRIFACSWQGFRLFKFELDTSLTPKFFPSLIPISTKPVVMLFQSEICTRNFLHLALQISRDFFSWISCAGCFCTWTN